MPKIGLYKDQYGGGVGQAPMMPLNLGDMPNVDPNIVRTRDYADEAAVNALGKTASALGTAAGAEGDIAQSLRVIQGVAERITEAGAQLVEMQRTTDLFKAVNGARSEMTGAYQGVMEGALQPDGTRKPDLDYKTMEKRFTDQSQEIVKRYRENLDEGQKAAFDWEYSKHFTAKALSVSERARKLQSDDFKATSLRELDSLLIAATDDPSLAQIATAKGTMIIGTLKSTGAITAVEAQDMSKKFAHNISRAEVDRAFAINPGGTIDSLWQGSASGAFPGLIGHERNALAIQYQEKFRTEVNRLRAEEREKARDAREAARDARERAQEAGVRLIAGNIGGITERDLVRLGAQFGLKPGEISSLVALNNSVAENPEAKLDLKMVLDNPENFNGPDAKREAKTYVLGLKVGAKTKSEMLDYVDKTIDSRIKQNSEDGYKALDKWVGSGIIKADDGKNLAWAQAREKIGALATTKKVTSMDALGVAMSTGLVNDKSDVLSVLAPDPAYGDYSTPQGFNQYYLNLTSALDAGDIDKQRFDMEIERMLNYRQVQNSPIYAPVSSIPPQAENAKNK